MSPLEAAGLPADAFAAMQQFMSDELELRKQAQRDATRRSRRSRHGR